MLSAAVGMRAARVFAVVVIVGVGAAAFRLSFATLRDLAVLAHVPASDAWLFPLIIDGTIVQATAGALVLAKSAERTFFVRVLIAGAVVSVAGNSLHAVAAGHPLPAWVCAVVAAVAPVGLLVDTHGLAVLFRAAQHTPLPAPAPVADPVTVPVSVSVETGVPEPVSVPDPAPVAVSPVVSPGVSRRRDPVKVARAVELRGRGMSFPDIAAALGISVSTARKYARSGNPPADSAPVSVPEPSPVPTPELEPVVVRAAAPVAPAVRPVVPVRSRPVAQSVLPLAIPVGG